jgi:hypothetical protein
MLFYRLPISITLIFAICFMMSAGCIGNQQSLNTTTFTTTTTTIFNTPTPAQFPANATNCTLPTLIFNDSQDITTSFSEGIICSTPSSQGTIPLGGIVFYTQGFTRIFDFTGKQIMIIDDKKATYGTPAGIASATSVFGPCYGNSKFIQENDTITLVYLSDNNTCSIIFIKPKEVTPIYTPDIR